MQENSNPSSENTMAIVHDMKTRLESHLTLVHFKVKDFTGRHLNHKLHEGGFHLEAVIVSDDFLDKKLVHDGDKERIQKNLETYTKVLSDVQQAQNEHQKAQREDERTQKRINKRIAQEREKIGTKATKKQKGYKKRKKK